MVPLVRGGTYVCWWYVYECPYYTQCPSLLLSLVASLLCMGCNIVLLSSSHLILSSLLSLLQATLPLLGLFIDSVEAVSHRDMPCRLQHAVIRSTYLPTYIIGQHHHKNSCSLLSTCPLPPLHSPLLPTPLSSPLSPPPSPSPLLPSLPHSPPDLLPTCHMDRMSTLPK